MNENNSSLGPVALSEITRAATEASAYSKPQIRFMVDHTPQVSYNLFDKLKGLGEDSAVREMLTMTAHGISAIVLTERDSTGAATWGPGGPLLAVESIAEGQSRLFEGYARPNPSFIYEGNPVLEGLVVIEDEPRSLSYGRAISLRQIASYIADLASGMAASPILSFSSPAQAPPHTHDRPNLRAREDEWPRSSSFALRFAIAVKDLSAKTRFELVDRISSECARLGFGFWVADTRGGFRQGLWFGVSKHDRKLARESYPTIADRRGDREVHSVTPVTIIGPARVGSTAAILAYLSLFPSLGLAACSITAIDDLAFIHLQIAMNHSAKRKLDAKNAQLNELLRVLVNRQESRVVPPLPFLEKFCPLACDYTPTPHLAQDARLSLEERCFDYQILAGPILEIVHSNLKKLPIWVSWRVKEREAMLGHVLECLDETLRELGLSDPPDGRLGVEYGICRASRDVSLKGKAKLSIVESHLPSWTGSKVNERAGILCSEIEQRWRAKILSRGLRAEASAADREYRLGHWTDDL